MSSMVLDIVLCALFAKLDNCSLLMGFVLVLLISCLY